MNADGSNQVNLTPFTTTTPDDLPDCSPDGWKILFEGFRGTDIDLLTMNANGSNQHVIVSNAADDVHPSWSPDGTRIIFERQGNIYAVGADGSNETLVVGEASLESAPVWSPDGTNIVFTSNRNGAPEVYTASTDESNQTRLTTNVNISDDYADWQANQPVAVGGITELSVLAARAKNSQASILPVAMATIVAIAVLSLFVTGRSRVRWRE